MSTFRNRTAQNAFTLLEVTIVMVMLVGLLALAWPRMSGVAKRSELRDSALKIKLALNEARDQAIQRGLEVQFIYGLQSNQYQLRQISSDQEIETSLNARKRDDWASGFASGSLPEGLIFRSEATEKPEDPARAEQQSETDVITFFPDGRGTNHDLQIAFQNGEMAITVAVRGLTGGVKISSDIQFTSTLDEQELAE
ncbi:MAG: GspH/FimT family pseudopilin [Planctomycetota bacterium]|nr:GspH/FimT family pseudopilin [Planctomycetota bacterium]